MTKPIKKEVHHCETCQQNKEGKTIYGEFKNGHKNKDGFYHKCWNCWAKYLWEKTEGRNGFAKWRKKLIQAYQEALQKCQNKELWYLKEDDDVHNVQRINCDNCGAYSHLTYSEDYGDIQLHVCYRCPCCRNEFCVSSKGDKTKEELIAELKELIDRHHQPEYQTSINPNKCKEESEKNGKIHVYNSDGSKSIIPVSSNSRERERENKFGSICWKRTFQLSV